MFETPRELSTISHDKSIVIKGVMPRPKTQVVGLMSKNDKREPIRLDQILNYVKTLHGTTEEFSLKKVLKSEYERLVE